MVLFSECHINIHGYQYFKIHMRDQIYLVTISQPGARAVNLDTCRNLNPQGSDNGRCFVIIPFTMRFYGCSIWISKWTPNPKQLKIGY